VGETACCRADRFVATSRAGGKPAAGKIMAGDKTVSKETRDRERERDGVRG